ncbi:MAG: hypothetical protein FJ222_05750 [Lentisphaerae bacterium]|nr:hypothetical protein [Lentisphaerota bacterium]
MNLLPRKPYLVALAATFGLVLFYHFGGGLWRPIKARLAGEKTVKQVLRELEPLMNERFQDLEALTKGEPMSILAFKEEQRLELWKQRGTGWEFVRSYPFTGFSGKLGPKLREGDGQIPEGVYRIEYLNPNSSFHLSIKVEYPNAFDREMAAADGREGLGFDIFIHGSSATIGCIPIGDQAIEELFYLIAKNGHRNATIIISPVDFRRGVSPPEVRGIDWETDLYASLSERLHDYPLFDTPNKESANKASIPTPAPP